MEANNVAAIREAMEALFRAVDKVLDRAPDGTWGIWSDCSEIARAMEKAKSALALPRRQCDVGTAEEQEKRFRECCGCRCMTKCKVYEKGIALGIVNKNNYYKVGCRFVWAQMPYEAESEKGATDGE